MTPNLSNALFLRVQEFMQSGNLDDAILLLEQARNHFAETADLSSELRAILLLAKIHHRREDLGTAQLFTEEVATLLAESVCLEPLDRAHAYLGLARLAPDIGELGVGFQHAQQALRLFQKAGDRQGQYEAHILCKLIAGQRGHQPIAMAHMEAATQLLRSLAEGGGEQTFLLNTRSHTYWYRGLFNEALQTAREAIDRADSMGPHKFRVYNRLLCANILRAIGAYGEAELLYGEAIQVLEETGLRAFRMWVDANWAWLDLLQQRHDQARRRLYAALETANLGQAMSFNVSLAGVFAQTGRYFEAGNLLNDSLHFYLTSGDELSVCAIRFHLAYVYLKTDHPGLAEDQLTLALAWMNQWNNDYFPHWWHPALVAEVCVYTLAAEIYPVMAERILVKRVGDAAIPHLRRLLSYPNVVVRQRAAEALSLLDGLPFEQITETEDDRVRQVLIGLLTSGTLRLAHLGRLIQKLQMSRQQKKINGVLLATFGLYVEGIGRQEIAHRLGRQEKTIRNYITLIYECFGLEAEGGRDERRRRLIEIAHAEGVVDG